MHIGLLTVFFLTSLVTVDGQIRSGITKEDARHLWYVSYINDFAIGYVEWQYGELAVQHQGASVPIYLELTADEWKSEGMSSRRNGSPARGPETSIGRSGRSRPFQYAPGSSLSFFRLWHAVNTSLESTKPHPDELTMQKGWADVRWTVTPGMVQDTMEVALLLVDAETGERLWLLDSVGARSGPADAVCQRYGTSADWCLHTVPLPDRFSGRSVAIEPLPYRFGPTPFGLLFMKRFNTFNMSVLYEREREEERSSALPRSEDVEFSKKIDSAYSHDLRMHYANAFMDDSCPPALLCLYSLDVDHQNALNAFLASMRFRKGDEECIRKAKADTTWWVSTLVGGLRGSGNESYVVTGIEDGELIASNVTDEGCMVTLRGVKSPAVSYRVMSSTGHLISSGVIGSAPFENHRLAFSAGTFEPSILSIILSNGRVMSVALPHTHD